MEASKKQLFPIPPTSKIVHLFCKSFQSDVGSSQNQCRWFKTKNSFMCCTSPGSLQNEVLSAKTNANGAQTTKCLISVRFPCAVIVPMWYTTYQLCIFPMTHFRSSFLLWGMPLFDFCFHGSEIVSNASKCCIVCNSKRPSVSVPYNCIHFLDACGLTWLQSEVLCSSFARPM